MDILPRAQLGPAHFHTPSMSRLEFTALRITGKCGQTFQPIEGCSSKVIAFLPYNSLFLVLSLYKLTQCCNVTIRLSRRASVQTDPPRFATRLNSFGSKPDAYWPK